MVRPEDLEKPVSEARQKLLARQRMVRSKTTLPFKITGHVCTAMCQRPCLPHLEIM